MAGIESFQFDYVTQVANTVVGGGEEKLAAQMNSATAAPDSKKGGTRCEGFRTGRTTRLYNRAPIT